VFILGGQSNMYGADSKLTSLPEELKKRQKDVLLFSGSEFSKLKPGSGRSFGPEITFGRTIADVLPNENFYLIKHSDGGTSLWNEWNLEDGRSYTRLKHVVDLGLQALVREGHTYEIAGILWTQGERDAWNLRTTAQYEADLQALIADMRSRWGSELPFFFSRLSVKQKARPIDAVRTAQNYVAVADPNTYVIDTDAMEMQRDNLHFTGQGYMDLGRAFAQAYLNTLSGETKTLVDQSAKPEKTRTQKGVIAGEQIMVNTSDGSLSFSTFDKNGNPAWHPDRTIDGSGLSNGIHSTEKNTGWKTERIDPSETFIQWDLGASYQLQSIHVWNLTDQKGNDVGVRSADIYFSNVEFPGDPEGEGAENWTRWKDGAISLPAAPATDKGNQGFDLAKATGLQLPDTPVRYIRFEVNGTEKAKKHHVGLAEIQFTGSVSTAEKAVSSDNSAKVVDASAPEISLLSPPHQATGVNQRRNLTVVFSKAVKFGTGSITLRTNNGEVVEKFDVTSRSKGLDLNGKTLTIHPSRDLADSTTYSLAIDATAIEDMNGKNFTGTGESKSWAFTTIVPDVTVPRIASLIPVNGKKDFFPADNLVIAFDELVGFDKGSIHIRKSDGTLVESFDVADPPAGLSRLGDTITINPSEDLPLGEKFYVEIEKTVIKDHAGNHFTGTQGKTTWNFATPATAQYAT
ncbi:MAG: Ig-like domain-containing protein, partial [Verrucomicrobiae bacterium]|nr:Ig-like domain-containing protein [Verrucomicrobiae bacterium]NNJ87738.1 hypothetical protein [Akkermansiaceae bacterium]